MNITIKNKTFFVSNTNHCLMQSFGGISGGIKYFNVIKAN